MSGKRPWNTPLHKHQALLWLLDIMEFFGVIPMMLLKGLSINVCTSAAYIFFLFPFLFVKILMRLLYFWSGRDKRPIKSLVVGRPILLALEDIDGSPSFLEKALRFLEKFGEL